MVVYYILSLLFGTVIGIIIGNFFSISFSRKEKEDAIEYYNAANDALKKDSEVFQKIIEEREAEQNEKVVH